MVKAPRVALRAPSVQIKGVAQCPGDRRQVPRRREWSALPHPFGALRIKRVRLISIQKYNPVAGRLQKKGDSLFSFLSSPWWNSRGLLGIDSVQMDRVAGEVILKLAIAQLQDSTFAQDLHLTLFDGGDGQCGLSSLVAHGYCE